MDVVVSLDQVLCMYVGESEQLELLFEMPHTTSISKRVKAAINALVDAGCVNANRFNVLIKGVSQNSVKYRIALEDLQTIGEQI